MGVTLALIVLLSIGATVVVDREVGGWSGVFYWARLRHIEHVQPLVWPREAFVPEAWKGSAVGTRYRFAKSIVSDPTLIGRTFTKCPEHSAGTFHPTRHSGSIR
jgi:hypothetical protein